MSSNPSVVPLHDTPYKASQCVAQIKHALHQVVVGQEALIEKLIIAMICKGHVLIEGMPGLAKTLTVNSLAQVVGLQFGRIQFTPDLLPSDILGTQIFNPKTFEFQTEKGPVFTNLLLADEINRAPAKVQSALLEAMQEKQITLGKIPYTLPSPFIVLATQNPIEQEGTYALPEAQMDRFMFKVTLGYPTAEEERAVMMRMAKPNVDNSLAPVVSYETLQTLSDQIEQIHLADNLQRYIIDLVQATRQPSRYGLDLDHYIACGASPRASIALALSARAYALLQDRYYVIPSDIRAMARDVLCHRIKLNHQAELHRISSETLVETLLAHIEIAHE